MKVLKKFRKVVLIFVLVLATSSLFAKEITGGDIYSHGGVFKSYSTIENYGIITVCTITCVCNDGTILTQKDWWWNW